MAATTKSVKDLVNPQKDGFLHQYSFKGTPIIFVVQTCNVTKLLRYCKLEEEMVCVAWGTAVLFQGSKCKY